MNNKPKPQPAATKPGSDQEAFEKLPEETKELMELKERESKTSGHEQVAVTRRIQDKSRKSES